MVDAKLNYERSLKNQKQDSYETFERSKSNAQKDLLKYLFNFNSTAEILNAIFVMDINFFSLSEKMKIGEFVYFVELFRIKKFIEQ